VCVSDIITPPEYEKRYLYAELYCARGEMVTVSVRRVYVCLSSAFPMQELLADVIARLRTTQ
jgi:hypothetical protein